ncbi:hypothetical protein OCS_05517 [Ophiocordyceps sinensis CO18]|uniref:Uncharacterized protein n=1 Tax=Ophiocordyceps sinensis (strain Co18 / CGMCC 3.14243) TaxID=911162 RepID=T5A055_OPHSC|nr:hypothetical protein OCS_05517 [Ophiocordyceps sinensis CO18]
MAVGGRLVQLSAMDRPESSRVTFPVPLPACRLVSLVRVLATTWVAAWPRGTSRDSSRQGNQGPLLARDRSASVVGLGCICRGVEDRIESVVVVASYRAVGLSREDVGLLVPALSLEVTHWMTTAEKITIEGYSSAARKRRLLDRRGSQTVTVAAHQAYPSRLSVHGHENRQVAAEAGHVNKSCPQYLGSLPYTMLLSDVNTAPLNVREATVRRREFAWLRVMFLKE